jgi:hypothetical protein
MSIAQLSPTSVAANPAYVNPQVRTDNSTTPIQANQSAQVSVQTFKTDTVTLSRHALEMSSKSSAAQDESKQSSAAKTYESIKMRK